MEHENHPCFEQPPQEEPKEYTSPSGRYRLMVTVHPTKPGCWEYSRGQVYSGDTRIADVHRNYAAFPFAWVEGHSDGHDYLVCGVHYMGQTVIRLDTGERRDYTEPGEHFCWVRIHPSPNGTMLGIEGCYWAAPYEAMVYDFTRPLDGPPAVLLTDHNNECFLGWNNARTCVLGVRHEVFNLEGHPWFGRTEKDITDNLTEPELEDLERIEEAHKGVWRLTEMIKLTWTRPEDK